MDLVRTPYRITIGHSKECLPNTCCGQFVPAFPAANLLRVAFQESIFRSDLSVALDLAECLDASVGMVNDHSAFRIDCMPFAGCQESGYGKGGIPYTAAGISSGKDDQALEVHCIPTGAPVHFGIFTRKSESTAPVGG